MMKSTIFTTKFQPIRLMGIMLLCMVIMSTQVVKVYGLVADISYEKVDSNLEDVEEKEDTKEKESNLEDFTNSNLKEKHLATLAKLCFRSMFVKVDLTNIEVVLPPPELLV